jgi:hypothetical protein
MSDLEAIADHFEIEALRGEFTDAVMMSDYDRLASLFTGWCGSPTSTKRPSAGRRSAPGRAAAGSMGLRRANHAPGHDPA